MSDRGTTYWHEKLQTLGVAVVIPTYNNAATLSAVLEDVLYYTRNIIVIDDGSTDQTAAILKTYSGIQLLTHPRNKGKGAALKNGLQQAREQGFRYVITLDSDGQHFASDIPLFIDEIEREPDTLLVGARNLEAENMPGKNTFANKFSNFWYKLETGIPLQDTQSGYRLYPIQRMGSMKYYTAKYEFELEAIVFAAWKEIPVKNITVNVYYPPKEKRVSHFRPLRDFTRISLLNTCLVLIAFLWIKPRNFFRKFTWSNIQRFFTENIRHTQESNAKISLAVMLGIFMGIVPIWGYQMLITLILTRLLKLNTVIAIVAANISIPPMIPFILYGSYATGCIALGRPVTLDFTTISFENISTVLEQYIMGSIIFAAICSLSAGFLSLGILKICRKNP